MIRLLTLAVLLGSASAHMQPYVRFVLTFEDARGRSATGLSVLIETREASGEADIRQGSATVTVEFPRDYSGPLRIRVFDRKRRAIALLGDSGAYLEMRELSYAHRRGALGKVNPNFGDPFDDGIEFVSGEGKVAGTGAESRRFKLAWDPDRMPEEERQEGERADEMDRKIALELQRNLEAVRGE